MTPPQKTLNEYFQEKYRQHLPVPEIERDPPTPKKEQQRKPSSREEKKFVKTIMYGLTAPLIFHTGGWGESFPDKQREWGSMLRLLKAADCIDQEMCTTFDAMAYMYSMSFVAPLTHDGNCMYFYLFRESLPKEWKVLIKGDEFIERYAELDENVMLEVKILRQKIFKRQISRIDC